MLELTGTTWSVCHLTSEDVSMIDLGKVSEATKGVSGTYKEIQAGDCKDSPVDLSGC